MAQAFRSAHQGHKNEKTSLILLSHTCKKISIFMYCFRSDGDERGGFFFFFPFEGPGVFGGVWKIAIA